MTPGIVITLSFLVILGRFLDFVGGPELDQDTKNALKQLASADGSRSTSGRGFVLLATQALNDFLRFWFGSGFISWAFHCFILSFTITSVVALAAGVWDPSVWDGRSFAAHEAVTVQIGCLILANFAVDLVSLATARWILNRIVAGQGDRAWLWLLVEVALTYLFLVIAMNASFSSIVFARGMITGYFLDAWDAGGLVAVVGEVATAWWLFFKSYTIPMLLTPIAEGRLLGLAETNLMVFSFTACLPGLLLVVTIGLGVLVDSTNAVTKGGVRSMLDSLSKDNQPIFLRLSLVASGLLALFGVKL